jgi:SPP1 gp7 family putative phage head morphogenesis protein
MNSSSYWRKREEKWIQQQMKEDAKQSQIIAEKYQKALDQIQKEIDANWERFAGKEGVTLSEAKKLALEMDVKSFSRKAKQYVKEKNFSKTANDELRLYNVTMRTSRLELLKSQLGLELIALSDELDTYTADTLTKSGTAEAKRQAGILGETVFTDYEKFIDIVANASFQGATFSERIWGNLGALKADLDRLLIRSITQGRNPRELARELRNLFDSSKFEAERLMRTETARVQIAVQMKSYQENGIEEYLFIAEPDACKICATMAKKSEKEPFEVENHQVGLNAPPMHPNCRCSTVPFVEELPAEQKVTGGVFDKTNLSDKVGKANYNKFVESLNAVEDERVKKLLDKFGEQFEFHELSESKDFVNEHEVQLSQKAFDGTVNKKAMQIVFHELGHAIDNAGIRVLGSDFDRVSELPKYKLKNDIKKDLLNLVNKELKEIKGESFSEVKNLKKIDIFDQGAIVRKYKQLSESNPFMYSSLSDMMESTGGFIDGPLGSGHGLKYWKVSGRQEAEFFAHMVETVVNEESRAMMYDLFPNAAKKWEKMLDDILREVE